MRDTERLLALEEIRQLKSKYFFYLDHKDWERWKAEVWAPDGSLEVPEILSEPVRGVDNIVEFTDSRFGDVVATHYGHMPIIELTSADSAKGIWAMEDILRWPADSPGLAGNTYIHGYGHYHETYTKTERGWRISSSRLTRLHVDRK